MRRLGHVRISRAGAVVGAAALCVSLVVGVNAAHATAPGRNGRIAYVLGGNIFTAFINNTGVTQITTTGDYGDPKWQGNSTIVADRSGVGIVTLPAVPGATGTPIPGTNSQDFAPTTAGKTIAFLRGGGFVEVYNGSGIVTLATNHTGVAGPRLSPNGQTVYFNVYNGTAVEVRRIPVTGGPQTVVTGPATGCGVSISCFVQDVSPDGQFVLYDREGGQTGLARIRADGTGPVTPLTSFDAYGVLSPDNTLAAAIPFAVVGTTIMTVPSGGGAVANTGIVADGTFPGSPGWSPA